MIYVLLIFIAFAAGGGLGVRYGKEIAIDKSNKDGFFTAYGRKFKATEILAEDNDQTS